MAGAPLSVADQSALTITAPSSHRLFLPFLLLGLAAAAIIPLVLFEVGKSNAKSNQDAFCKANNIPLSMCAGG